MKAPTPTLSPREIDLLRALAQGKSNTQIADEMALSRQTVKNYLSRLYIRLGVRTRTEAAIWAVEHGVLDRDAIPHATHRQHAPPDLSLANEQQESFDMAIQNRDAKPSSPPKTRRLGRRAKGALAALVCVMALLAGGVWATTATYGYSTMSFPVSTGKVEAVDAFLRARFGDEVKHWVETMDVIYADGTLRKEPNAFFTFPTPLNPLVSGQLTEIVTERTGSGPYRLEFWRRLLHIAPPEADEISLHLEDLPAGSQLMSEGYIEIANTSHPLHVADVPESAGLDRMAETPFLYNYKTIYHFSAFAADPFAAVANFVYTYPDAITARQALNWFEHEVLHGDAENVDAYTTGKAIHGELYYLAGSEGDHVYWFVATKGAHLFLAMANGLEKEATREALLKGLGIRE